MDGMGDAGLDTEDQTGCDLTTCRSAVQYVMAGLVGQPGGQEWLNDLLFDLSIEGTVSSYQSNTNTIGQRQNI